MDWPSMSPDLNPIEHLWGILKWKVEERKVSNIHQLCDVVMEEWKRTPVATCEALVNSMPKRVKTMLENNGGHTKYWHSGPNLDIFHLEIIHYVLNQIIISVSFVRTELGKTSFKYAATSDCNLLQKEMKLQNLVSYNYFKSLLCNLESNLTG